MTAYEHRPNRKPPVPAEKPKPKRNGLRRVSKKRAKLNREAWKEREEFRKLFPLCCWCGVRDPANHTIDEIVRGSSRGLAIVDRRAWLPACYDCNSVILTGMTIEHKLAIKLCIDPEYFDLQFINRIRGRAPGSITLADVAEWLKPVAFTHAGECLSNYLRGKPIHF